MNVVRTASRAAIALLTAALLGLAVAGVTAAASADAVLPPVPPVPALPAPLSSLVGGDPPAQSPTGSAAPSAAASAATRGESAAATTVATQMQRLLVAEINVVRRSHGRGRLTLSTQLTRAGQEHARELALAGYFSHDWSDGTPFGRWIRRFYPVAGARSWSAAENLEWSVQEVTPGQAVELWLASPTHRRILLDKRWRQVGLGVIRADGAGGIYGGRSVVIMAAEFGLRR
jgi:uncharacterized protein YkwD